MRSGEVLIVDDPEEPETVPEYALQVVPVGDLNPQQLISGLRAPKGYEPDAVQIMPVEISAPTSLAAASLQREKRTSAVCFTWKKLVPVNPGPSHS
jgi:hypothetical protein